MHMYSPQFQTLLYCKKSLEMMETPEVFLRRSLVYTKRQNFSLAIADINAAKRLIYADDVPRNMQLKFVKNLEKVKAYYEETSAKYEVSTVLNLLML